MRPSPFGRTGTDDGVHFIDEKNDILGLADFLHDRLDALLELSAVFGARNHQGQVESDDALVAQQFGNIAGNNFLGQSLDDGGLPDPGFPDQHRVVLGAATEDLDDTFDFTDPPDDGVEFVFPGQFGQITAEGFEGGSFEILLAAAGFGLSFGPLVIFLVALEIGIEFAEDLVTGAVQVDIQALENTGGHPVPLPEQSEENVFGAHVAMAQGLGFLAGEREHLLDARGVGDVAGNFRVRAGADLFLDFHADGLQVQSHFLEHIDRDPLPEFDEAEEQMLGSHVVVVEAIGFFSCQGEDLLGARCKIVHMLLWTEVVKFSTFRCPGWHNS
jgi:hypothetical protein